MAAGKGWKRSVLAALLPAFLMVMLASAGITRAQGTQPDVEPYRLSPGDVILINVLEDSELDRQALILPDGRISLPVAGTLVAAGRTPAELERIIRQRLAGQFVEPPTVTVGVITLAEENDEDDLREVFVLGEVGSPGRYEYDPEQPITVLKALSLAGGLGPFAARSRIQVREALADTETVRLFDYDAVEEGSAVTSRNLATLADGAVIIVPERGFWE